MNERVEGIIHKLGPKYKLVGEWLNDKEFDPTVSPEVAGRYDFLIGKEGVLGTAWVSLYPDGNWVYVANVRETMKDKEQKAKTGKFIRRAVERQKNEKGLVRAVWGRIQSGRP